MIPCDRCKGQTKGKFITSKKPATFGQQFKVLECLGQCRAANPKYSYTFFPPKDAEPAALPSWDERQGGHHPQPFPEPIQHLNPTAPLNGYSNEAALSVIASELRQLRMAIQSIFGKDFPGVPKVQAPGDLADEVQFRRGVMTKEEMLKESIEQLTALEEYQYSRIDKQDPMSEIIYERIVKARDLIQDVLEGNDE